MELVEPSVTHAALWPLSVPGVINQLHLKQLTEFWPPERDQLVNRYRMMAMRAVVNLSLTPHVYSDWFCSCSFRFLFYESKSCLSIRSFSSKFQMCNCWGRNIGHNYIVQKKHPNYVSRQKKGKVQILLAFLCCSQSNKCWSYLIFIASGTKVLSLCYLCNTA